MACKLVEPRLGLVGRLGDGLRLGARVGLGGLGGDRRGVGGARALASACARADCAFSSSAAMADFCAARSRELVLRGLEVDRRVLQQRGLRIELVGFGGERKLGLVDLAGQFGEIVLHAGALRDGVVERLAAVVELLAQFGRRADGALQILQLADQLLAGDFGAAQRLLAVGAQADRIRTRNRPPPASRRRRSPSAPETPAARTRFGPRSIPRPSRRRACRGAILARRSWPRQALNCLAPSPELGRPVKDCARARGAGDARRL